MSDKTWKHDFTMLVFGWLSKSVAKMPEGENPEYWATFQRGYRRAADIAAEPFSYGGWVNNPLNFCADNEGEPVTINELSSQGTRMSPAEILTYIEDLFSNERIKDVEIDGIMMSCRHAVMLLRNDWFCKHWWVDDEVEIFIPDEKGAKPIEIQTERCTKCNLTREKEI